MTGGEAQTIEARFAPDKRIGRFGWLGDASVFSAEAGRLITPPSDKEDRDAPEGEVIYLQRSDNTYLVKTEDGLKFVEDARIEDRVRIAKVVSIPYRWRRPGETVDQTRQVDLYICYNGPSH